MDALKQARACSHFPGSFLTFPAPAFDYIEYQLLFSSEHIISASLSSSFPSPDAWRSASTGARLSSIGRLKRVSTCLSFIGRSKRANARLSLVKRAKRVNAGLPFIGHAKRVNARPSRFKCLKRENAPLSFIDCLKRETAHFSFIERLKRANACLSFVKHVKRAAKMPWLAQLVLRKKRRVELNDDIWLIVIAELSKISEPSLLALRLVNRNLAFLATPLAFRHITICTGAGKAPRMNEGLEYLVSEDGNRLRQYIREIDVTDSKFQRGQFKGWLIQELIEKLTCLEVFRYVWPSRAMVCPTALEI